MKKATTYIAEAPDGTQLIKRSFNVSSDTAYMGIYNHNGKWLASGIVSQPREDWGQQSFVEAKKTRINNTILKMKTIITVILIGAAFACKKNADVNTEAPVKYYFKIAPISLDGSANDTTTYKYITVD